MKVPFFAVLLLVPVVALGQAPRDSGNDNATRPTPEQCRKDPAFPGCPAQPDMTATTNGNIPPGGWCDSVRPGCPTHPHIRTCDNCSAQAMQNKATLAATAEGDNYAYVVNRPARQVRYYWIFVTFNSNGVHKSVVELAIQGEGPQVMKDALQAAADVNIWLKSLNAISEGDLNGAGVDMPYDNAFDLAPDFPGNDFNRAIEDYMNANIFAQGFFDRLVDTLTSFVADVVSNIADTAVSTETTVTFEWSDGSQVDLVYTLQINSNGSASFSATIDRTSLETASGEYIPSAPAGFGIGSGGGTTDPFDVGDPSGATDFRNYLQEVVGSSCSVETNCSFDDNGHYVCIGTVNC